MTSTNRRLPVIAAFMHAVHSVRNNIGFAIKISWPLYAALVPLLIAGNVAIYVVTGGDAKASPGFVSIISSLMVVATLIAFAVIAVRWHRFILRDVGIEGISPFAVEPEAWQYAGNSVLLVLLAIMGAVAAAIIAVLLSGMSGTISPLTIVFIVAAALAIALVVTRMSIKLPAIALGRKDFSFGAAWKSTVGNNWQLLGYTMLNSAVVLTAAFLVEAITSGISAINPMLGFSIDIVLQLSVNWLLTIFSCSVITSLYGFFVENRDF